ncbi:MAG: GTPase RsgA, partial [Kamptonema sp. SIO4C4]|nr:GTPase RsgA [Kamptonema sp. SIO4C4]
MNLEQLGWSAYGADLNPTDLSQGYTFGRVACALRDRTFILTPTGNYWATLTGNFRYHAQSPADFPVVGDWVTVDENAQITTLLPRKSQLSRQAAGKVTQEQLLAANIDTVFILCGLDHDFNLRRIERYLVTIWESGANPVILLNKADLCEAIGQVQAEVENIALGVPIYALSAAYNTGIEKLLPYLNQGQTVALLGFSGVGKSTLTNQLLGDNRQAVQTVRTDDSRGRHTTTQRELFPHW